MKKQNPAIIMTLLITIFLTPMLVAWLAYSKGLFLSGKTVNCGTLLLPPVPLTNFAITNDSGQNAAAILKGRWALIYLTNEPHSNYSQKYLYYLRQIRQATGKDRERIARAIVLTQPSQQFAEWLRAYFPGTYLFTIPKEKLTELKTNLPKELELAKGSLYLVDPLGNIMLFYAPNALPKGILKDLQRALKVSQIG